MRNIAKAILTLCFICAMAVGTSAPVKAQYYYYPPPPPPPPPYYGGYGYGCYYYYGHPVPYGYHGPYGDGYGSNPDPHCTYAGCCPLGWTVQGGVCKPYRGW